MNKTALITGASKRIGRALTEHLAEKGWNIIIHYNNSQKPAEELAQLLKSRYPTQQFLPVKANLKSLNEVEDLIPKLISSNGKFQLLINNASIFNPGYIADTQADLFEVHLDVNLKAPFFLMQSFASACKSGNIINFVDTRITTSKTNFAAYSLSKKALWEATKMAALEFAPKMRVNAIAPGVTLAPEGEDETYLEKLAKDIPMKEPGGIQPILKSIDFILENDHLTGQLLFADGGENLGKNA